MPRSGIRYAVPKPVPRPGRPPHGSVRGALLSSIAILVCLVVPVAGAAGSARLTASPDTVVPGATVKVRGTGFARNQTGLITLDTATSGPSFRANGKGAFSASLRLARAIPSGPHAIVARSNGGDVLATVTIVVLVSAPTPTPPTPTPTPPQAVASPTAAPSGAPAPTAAATDAPGPTSGPTPGPSPVPTAVPTPSPTPPAPTPSASAGAAYYVAPSGSDHGAGTADDPWRTIAYAVGAAPEGATIRVQTGTYGPFRIARSRLTVEPAAGANVTVSGGSSAMVITGSHIVVRGLHVTGASAQGIWVDGAADVVLRGLQVDHNAGHGAQIIRSSEVTVRDSAFSDNQLGGLRELDDTSGGRYVGNTIARNGHDGQPYNGDGLLLKGAGAYVSGNVISGNGDSPTFEHGIYAASTASDYEISGNVLDGNAASGIKASGAGSVTGNTISGSVRGIVFADDGGTVTVTGNTVSATTYAIAVTSNCVLGRYRSDYNAFATKAFGLGGTLDLAAWRTATGQDLHST